MISDLVLPVDIGDFLNYLKFLSYACLLCCSDQFSVFFAAICSLQTDIKLREKLMVTTTFDVKKFTRGNDFNIWQIKMRALLVHT